MADNAPSESEEMTYEKALDYRKKATYGAAAGCIIFSILNIISITGTALTHWIMSFYFLGIGIIIIAVEYG